MWLCWLDQAQISLCCKWTGPLCLINSHDILIGHTRQTLLSRVVTVVCVYSLFCMQGHCWAWEIWPHDKSLLQICVSERSLIPSPFLKSKDKPAEHDAVVLCMQNTCSLFHLMFLTYRIAAIIVFDLTRYGVLKPLCMMCTLWYNTWTCKTQNQVSYIASGRGLRIEP